MGPREIIDRFGGQSALARLIGKKPSAVAYWIKAGSIPAKWHPTLLQLAAQRQVPLSSDELTGAATVEPQQVVVLPVARYPGQLLVGDYRIGCYVLDDGRRVISRTGATDFLTDGRGGGNLESYVGVKVLEPHVPPGWQDELVDFTMPEVTNKRVQGITAETFLGICRAYMAARDLGLLSDRQTDIAIRAGAFTAACSTIGLLALIDEATGYQYERAEDALRFKLSLYLEEEMRKWEKTFPDQLWEEFGRLTGWRDPISARPKYWGKLVMELVYEYLDADVAEWLRVNAPRPRRGQNYHQWMSEQYGLRKLNEHIWMLVGLASACHSMPELRRRMAERFGKVPVQLTMFTDPPRFRN